MQNHKHKPIWSLYKCTCLRIKIYTIVKLKWEHKNNDPYKHGCISNTIYVYYKSNYHGIWHNNHEKHENQYMLKINTIKACKLNGN